MMILIPDPDGDMLLNVDFVHSCVKEGNTVWIYYFDSQGDARHVLLKGEDGAAVWQQLSLNQDGLVEFDADMEV